MERDVRHYMNRYDFHFANALGGDEAIAPVGTGAGLGATNVLG